MGKLLSERIVASIDIGTTKICVLVARMVDDTQFEIIGVGKAPSLGLQKGVVVDVSKTVYAIRAAVQEAELMAQMPIESVVIGVAGAHIARLTHRV